MSDLPALPAAIVDPLDDVDRFSRELGLETHFFQDLLKEDDWSFVIKLHALVEAAVSHLVTETCGKPELLETFTRMPLGNTGFGKLRFAQALGCLDANDLDFILALSDVRNEMAHDVRNANLTLAQYLEGLDANGFNTFVKRVGPRWSPIKVADGRHLPPGDFTREFPKIVLYLSAMMTIGLAYNKKLSAKAKRELAEQAVALSGFRRGVAEGLLKSILPAPPAPHDG